mmetsp:Transcript_13060/g.16240  ORF Transcript_13060/g.16240 Transcript_13060/m.16240 type:complete len:186 (-) Transcript_13060:196-753(-)|eukprot:CAMPEP_0204833368 /NCGR_PEP_ID=MMETSP1346-20131115/16603_1 /ASSEMBLY_ACC=CAM_ASM_000771 /TAXON_ID=215587 /ORGANISM="Aplanochytrium stocchinoi, Strain GSBS06" /LENGTH=185 /DNA_ID=CAMNT_0051965851 /DNA_START=257 /DNA_END=814 /DNA_ORIENTATION=+
MPTSKDKHVSDGSEKEKQQKSEAVSQSSMMGMLNNIVWGSTSSSATKEATGAEPEFIEAPDSGNTKIPVPKKTDHVTTREQAKLKENMNSKRNKKNSKMTVEESGSLFNMKNSIKLFQSPPLYTQEIEAPLVETEKKFMVTERKRERLVGPKPVSTKIQKAQQGTMRSRNKNYDPQIAKISARGQ